MKLIVDSCVFIDAFDPQSSNHLAAICLLTHLRDNNRLVTMPAHGWFEVQCALQKLTIEQRFIGPQISGVMNYPIELVHIDKQFIEKYAMADIPYIKAADHIYVAIAKINNWPLVTSDARMISVAGQAGIRIYEPAAYLQEVTKSGTP